MEVRYTMEEIAKMISEQKPANRLPLAVKVEYRKTYARNCELGLLKNISLTGAFLQTHKSNLVSNDKLILTFNVSGRERKIQATVVWTNCLGCGIKLIPFNNRDVQIIDDLMYFIEANRENRRVLLDDIFKKVA